MAVPPNVPDVIPLEASLPAAPLESILCTEELLNRPGRPPDYAKENAALAALVGALADSPRTILQTLADKVLEVLDADSAGLSLLTKDGKRFYWAAIAGAWQPHLGGGTPRDFGPCGDVLDRNITMLFTHWERRYPYLNAAMPLAEEGLLVPFFVNGKSVGTIWAIAHRNHRKFDSEDQRLLESMGRFASAAYQTVESIEELKSEAAARETAQMELRKLTDSLEAQVRARTLELERSEALMAEAQRLSSTGSWRLNVGTGEVVWSREFFAILGFDPENTAPSYALHLQRVHPDDRSMFDQLRSAAISERWDYGVEYRLLLPGGAVKYLHAIGHCVDKDGQLEYVGAVQDVTKRHLAEEALLAAQTALAHANRVATLGEISATIAHEVNQPLATIRIYGETGLRWLDSSAPNVAKARDLIGRMLEDVQRASEIVDRIRAMASQRATERKLLSLDDVIKDSLVFLRHEFQSRGVSVSLDLASALPPVTGDGTQLQQVVVNLAVNAAQAMTEAATTPRRLLICTRVSAPDMVSCTFEDSGPGIDPANLPRLFDSFFTTKDSGMGLGLPITRSIIEAHDGHVQADNKSALGGARFSFTLPASGSAAA